MDQETLRTLIITIPLILTAWAALRATKKISEVKNEVAVVLAEVKSGNELKTGELASAAESRRIDGIPEGDRTAQEARHIEAVPVPAKGHEPQTQEE